jgi:hypothetical protein
MLCLNTVTTYGVEKGAERRVMDDWELCEFLQKRLDIFWNSPLGSGRITLGTYVTVNTSGLDNLQKGNANDM